MKKYILFPLLVGLIPNVVFGASARYTQLVREKQHKMEQLEKCMGATKGLKIAGVSTLGLTAVGVAGNIYEAKVKNDTDKAIEKVDKKIEKTQQEIADKQAQKAEAEQEKQAKAKATCEADGTKTYTKNGECVDKTKKQTQTVSYESDQEQNSEGEVVELEESNETKEGAGGENSDETLVESERADEEAGGNGKKEPEKEESQIEQTVVTNNTAQNLEKCKSDVSFVAKQKWNFGKAVEDNFRDMASSYKLAVEDDTEIYNRHKTTIYKEIFAELKKEIDDFIIPKDNGGTWVCNGLSVSSSGCPGKTFQQCSKPFYDCKLDAAKMRAESRARDKYIEALTQEICYNTSL